MTQTYEPSLPTDRDHVRFLIGDTNVTSEGVDAKLQDEEIDAVIAEQTATGAGLKYFAAAECLSVLMMRWSQQGEGFMEKEVGDLRLKYGQDSSAKDALGAWICELRERGAFLLIPSSKHFKVLGL